MDTQTNYLETPVDSFTYECQKQLKLKEQLESEGFSCVDDPSGLYDKIGTIQEVETYCELFTPRLLAKLYGKGSENLEHAFWLVPLWQIIKFNYIVPAPGEYFSAKYVIGVRRVGEKAFVPSLRLPLN
jgi:hypothetical protein